VPAPKSAAGSWKWMGIAAMVAIGLVLMPFISPRWRTFEHDAAIRVLTLFSRTRQREAAIGALMEALPKDDRMVATRITGFPYAPHHIMRGEPGNETPAQMIAEGKAEELIETTAGDDSPESRHARGIAHLLLGRNDDAIKELTSATSAGPNDARAWSDLAAAYFAARKYDQAYQAADRAVQLDPNLNEARFNRALATSNRMPAESKKEWIDYLNHDSTGPWAEEARTNLQDLEPPKQ
jgi:tetratricopeptide (TPR) repeat protein